MKEQKLNKYTVLLEVTVYGETPDDAIEYVNDALDRSDLITQDGIISVNVLEDAEELEDTYEEDDC